MQQSDLDPTAYFQTTIMMHKQVEIQVVKSGEIWRELVSAFCAPSQPYNEIIITYFLFFMVVKMVN